MTLKNAIKRLFAHPDKEQAEATLLTKYSRRSIDSIVNAMKLELRSCRLFPVALRSAVTETRAESFKRARATFAQHPGLCFEDIARAKRMYGADSEDVLLALRGAEIGRRIRSGR